MSSPSPNEPEGGAATFLEQISVEPIRGAAGRYRARLASGWNAPVFPSGGLVTAVALRAMETALGRSDHRLRTFTTMFVSTVNDGPVEIEVRALREGRRMSQLQATVRNPGDTAGGHVTIAAFGERRDGFEFVPEPAPEVDDPDAYPGRVDPPPGVPTFPPGVFDRMDVRRIRYFNSYEDGWEGGDSEAIRWIRFQETPRGADGIVDRFAMAVLADTMPGTLVQYLGPGAPFFHCPSVDLTLHVFADTRSDWVLTRARCHQAGDGYASAAIELWDEERRLLARGNQVMLVRFPEPESLQPA